VCTFTVSCVSYFRPFTYAHYSAQAFHAGIKCQWFTCVCTEFYECLNAVYADNRESVVTRVTAHIFFFSLWHAESSIHTAEICVSEGWFEVFRQHFVSELLRISRCMHVVPRGRDDAVSVLTGLLVGRPGFDSQQDWFLLRQNIETYSGAHPAFSAVDTGVVSSGIDRTGRENHFYSQIGLTLGSVGTSIPYTCAWIDV
jgi:hypothetical protein